MGDIRNETRSVSTRGEEDDVDKFIDAYDYSTHSRSSRVPSTVHGGRYGQRNQQRRIHHDSLYSEITGNQRLTPEPRQPLKRELSGASRLTKTSISSIPKTRQSAKEGVLVDIAEDEKAVPSLPLQMASNTGTSAAFASQANVGQPTEAQAYMMSVRPGLSASPSQPIVGAIAPSATGGSFMPIPVHLVPNTTGGQGSYWLTPVPHNPYPQPQPQTSVDTVVLQPMNTGTSSSRNPFRQGTY